MNEGGRREEIMQEEECKSVEEEEVLAPIGILIA
jgi:hypothetical protein